VILTGDDRQLGSVAVTPGDIHAGGERFKITELPHLVEEQERRRSIAGAGAHEIAQAGTNHQPQPDCVCFKLGRRDYHVDSDQFRSLQLGKIVRAFADCPRGSCASIVRAVSGSSPGAISSPSSARHRK
jgi:hypothetical protein